MCMNGRHYWRSANWATGVIEVSDISITMCSESKVKNKQTRDGKKDRCSNAFWPRCGDAARLGEAIILSAAALCKIDARSSCNTAKSISKLLLGVSC